MSFTLLQKKPVLGIDLSPAAIRTVALSGSLHQPVMQACAEVPLPTGALRPSHREPNIIDGERLATALQESWQRCGGKERRVALSLPDAAGRVTVLELDSRYRTHAEGLDLVRWKLRKSLGIDPQDLHLDFQVVGEQSGGELIVLVAMIAKPIIGQYEELLGRCGLQGEQIDFASFSLARLFQERASGTEHYATITLSSDMLSLFILLDRQPVFFRAIPVGGGGGSAQRLFLELNSSLVVFREQFPGRELQQVYCLLPPAAVDELTPVLAEATGLVPLSLNLERYVAQADRQELFAFAAAIGAALGRW